MKHNNAVESELKYGLSQLEYTRLLRTHRQRGRKIQKHTNYYFDGDRLSLHRRRIGLRIRLETGSQAVVTLKHPKAMGVTNELISKPLPFLAVRMEFESKISRRIARQVIVGKRSLLSVECLAIEELKRIYGARKLPRIHALGSMETRRVVLPSSKSFRLELDQSWLFGETFYELEVETHRPAAADRWVRHLFSRYKVR